MKNVYLIIILTFLIQCAYPQFSRMPLNYPYDTAGHPPNMISIVDENTIWVGTLRQKNYSTFLPYSVAVKTSDGGHNWEFYPIPAVGSPKITDVEALDANTCYYFIADFVTAGGQIWKTVDGGSTWTKKTTIQFTGGYGDIIHSFSQDTIIAIGDPTAGYFEIQISTDGGNSWNRVPQSQIPPILSEETARGGRQFSAIGNTIWFGTSKGRCFKSVDKGNHWTVASFNPGSNVGVWSVCFGDLLHGISCKWNSSPGAYYTTSDGGDTWTPLSLLPGYFWPYVSRVDGINGGYVLSVTAPSPGAVPTSVFFTNDFFNTLTEIDSGLASTGYIYFKNATTGWLSGNFPDSNIYKYSGDLTSITDKKPISESIGIIPNPSNQNASLTFPTAIVGHRKTIRIYDLTSRLVEEFVFEPSVQSINLNSSKYLNGVYTITLISDNAIVNYCRWVIFH